MIATIRGNNGSVANFASVAIQPQPVSTVAAAVQQQTTVLTSPSAAVLPPKEVPLPVPVVVHSPNQVSVIKNPSLASLVTLHPEGKKLLISYGTSYNAIIPIYSARDASRVYDPRVTQGFVTTTTKFQPYEQLTGIAQERPEIVMLTHFEPLFDRDASHTAPSFVNSMQAAGLDPFMTDAGRFLDAQCNIKNLISFNVSQNLSAIRARYANVDQDLDQRNDAFLQALRELRTDATFLLNTVRIIEAQKSQLDLRHDIYIVDPQEVSSFIAACYTQQVLSSAPPDATGLLTSLVADNIRLRYNCVDTLVDLGYTRDSVTNVFASTKIWMQMLSEFKNVSQHHSLPFLDITPQYQKNDNNPSTILVPPVSYFGLATLPASIEPVSQLINTQPGNSSPTVSKLSNVFNTLYQNVLFKDEEARIAALAHVLSQEFRYSYGLSKPPVLSALQKSYGYTYKGPGNTTIFDSIIGRFGNNITDFPSAADTGIVNVAYDQTALSGSSIGVLTYESKYIEGDTGTLTPGGDFYFDQIMQTNGSGFNTTNVDSLTKKLDSQLQQLLVMVDGFNMLMLPKKTPDEFAGSDSLPNSFLNSDVDTVKFLLSNLLSPTTGQALPQVSQDRLGAVFAFARNDVTVKSILFLYTLSKISRNYSLNVPFLNSEASGDNTPLVDQLIDQLITQLEAAVPRSRSTVQLLVQRGLDNNVNTSSLTSDSIKSALRVGTGLTNVIELFMSCVISQFQQLNALSGNNTRYGGYLDTVVMMVAFDLAISAVARWSNQNFVGNHSSSAFVLTKGQSPFVVAQTSTDHRQSFNEIIQRLTGEHRLVRQLLIAIINVMFKLSGSLKGVSNYFNSPQALASLQKIAGIINNQQLLGMLINEQQIMLLASAVEDMLTANQSTTDSAYQSNVADGNKAFSDTPHITVLDESNVPSAVQAALNGFFGQGDIASSEANNKRILTIGIPSGFTQRLKQKVGIQNQKRVTFENKRNDIVNVTVYKVDMNNPDIIYQPVRHLFEMSRFPTRYGTSRWLSIPDQPTLADIINAVPTQSFSQDPNGGTASSLTAGVEYASSAVADNAGVKSARAAFDSPAYSFLTSREKAEILNNHVTSQLLEIYIKLMTGINVAEYCYEMAPTPQPIEGDFVTVVTDHTMAHLSEFAASQASSVSPATAQPAGGVLFSSTGGRSLPPVLGSHGNRTQTQPALSNPSGVAGQVSAQSQFSGAQQASPQTKTVAQQGAVGDANSSLSSLNPCNVSLAVSSLQTISSLAQTLSSISDPAALEQRLLMPKQFDRVFNIFIDPRDFLIDVEKTNETPWGKQALDLLIQQGDVVPSSEDDVAAALRTSIPHTLQSSPTAPTGRSFPQGAASPNVNSYQYRERDRNAGDLTFDKYFVTIETYGEDET